MKKLTIVLVLTILSSAVVAGEFDENQSVLLRWKLAEGESIAYASSMDPIDTTKESVLKFDLEVIPDGYPIPDKMKEEGIELQFPSKSTSTNILTKKPDGRISVKMIGNSVSLPKLKGIEIDSAVAALWKKMDGTVQLRGEIDETGKVTSFWLEQPQSNLVAMWFQLPEDPVKVGDTWSVDAKLLGMGHGFIPDEARRTNEVQLTELSEAESGDTVATIEYALAEYVNGIFRHPMLDKDEPSMMSYVFYAEAKFLVNKGRWLEFKGQAHVRATGMTTADSHSHFTMVPMPEVPKKLLELE